MTYSYLGELLKEKRKKAGLSQLDVAIEVGTSQKSYNSWELGKYDIKPQSRRKLFDFFDIPMEYWNLPAKKVPRKVSKNGVLVIKVNSLVSGKILDELYSQIKMQMSEGLVVLPKYCEAIFVPDGLDILVTQAEVPNGGNKT